MITNERLQRTASLLGNASMERLAKAHVAVFGIGGVGGACAEALARSGIGTLSLIDPDTVSVSNLNRQAFATTDMIGQPKLLAARKRLLSVAPDIALHEHAIFYLPETANELPLTDFDYIVDAVDTVTAKIELIVRAKEAGIPIISSMGTGNKLDPTQLEITDLSKTSVCPLARVMRRELKKRHIQHLTVVYSREEPLTPLSPIDSDPDAPSRHAPGSTAFVPNAAGLAIASRVVRDLLQIP